MHKSPVSGVAGAVRIQKLDLAGLRDAEQHGKRETESSKARIVRDAPPITTTGLDLEVLYNAHVKDAFVPKGNNLAIHALVQFPTKLVDGSDANYMLTHACRFVESVWGPNSIFGVRVDRDEKGVTNVDVFVAPKYTKKTKHTEKVAVSLTRDLKRLVAKNNGSDEKAHKWAVGRALQQELFVYFRDIMQLPGVQRGDPKISAGSDWKTAEQMRMEELEGIKIELEEEKRKVAELEQQLIEQAKADREQARAKQEELEASKIAAEMEEKRAREAREIAERLQQEAEALRSQSEAASQKAAEKRTRSNAEIARREAKLAADLDAVAVLKKRTEADATSATEAQRAAVALMETANAELALVKAERAQLERDRDREAAQMALLARAVDDDKGLALRRAGDRFSMAKSLMTQPEKTAYESPWSAGVAAIGRKLADALEAVRRTLLRLADKEWRLERERQEHERAVAAHQDTLRAHQNAVRDLDIRFANIDDKEMEIELRLAVATEASSAALAIQREAIAAKQVQDHWLTVIAATGSAANDITIDDSGKVAIAPQFMASLPEPIRSTLQNDAPAWAKTIVRERQALTRVRLQAEAAETDWKRKAEAVSADQQRIERSRKVLDAIVSGKWEAVMADGLMTLRHDDDSENRNVRRIPLADIEPSLLHAAQALTRLSAKTASVLELHDSLTKERSALAKVQPERASQIEEEQRRTDDKIRKVLRLPPGWGPGIDM